MDDEPLWRSRLRWRWRGALLWPTFVVLTFADALLLGVLPISGDGGTGFVPAALLAGFFNLLAVAVAGPLAALVLRRRVRPDLPRVIAEDYTGTAALGLVTVLLLVGGLLHAPVRDEAERDMAAQARAARDYAARHAPVGFRGHTGAMTTVKEDDELYRTCVPGTDPDRWFCMLVSTETSPPGITVDPNRESNESRSGRELHPR